MFSLKIENKNDEYFMLLSPENFQSDLPASKLFSSLSRFPHIHNYTDYDPHFEFDPNNNNQVFKSMNMLSINRRYTQRATKLAKRSICIENKSN